MRNLYNMGTHKYYICYIIMLYEKRKWPLSQYDTYRTYKAIHTGFSYLLFHMGTQRCSNITIDYLQKCYQAVSTVGYTYCTIALYQQYFCYIIHRAITVKYLLFLFCFRQFRLVAYRIILEWALRGQQLVKGNRTPLPSCVVDTIQKCIPLTRWTVQWLQGIQGPLDLF